MNYLATSELISPPFTLLPVPQFFRAQSFILVIVGQVSLYPWYLRYFSSYPFLCTRTHLFLFDYPRICYNSVLAVNPKRNSMIESFRDLKFDVNEAFLVRPPSYSPRCTTSPQFLSALSNIILF